MKSKILKNMNFAEDDVRVNGICTDSHIPDRSVY